MRLEDEQQKNEQMDTKHSSGAVEENSSTLAAQAKAEPEEEKLEYPQLPQKQHVSQRVLKRDRTQLCQQSQQPQQQSQQQPQPQQQQQPQQPLLQQLQQQLQQQQSPLLQQQLQQQSTLLQPQQQQQQPLTDQRELDLRLMLLRRKLLMQIQSE